MSHGRNPHGFGESFRGFFALARAARGTLVAVVLAGGFVPGWFYALTGITTMTGPRSQPFIDVTAAAQEMAVALFLIILVSPCVCVLRVLGRRGADSIHAQPLGRVALPAWACVGGALLGCVWSAAVLAGIASAAGMDVSAQIVAEAIHREWFTGLLAAAAHALGVLVATSSLAVLGISLVWGVAVALGAELLDMLVMDAARSLAHAIFWVGIVAAFTVPWALGATGAARRDATRADDSLGAWLFSIAAACAWLIAIALGLIPGLVAGALVAGPTWIARRRRARPPLVRAATLAARIYLAAAVPLVLVVALVDMREHAALSPADPSVIVTHAKVSPDGTYVAVELASSETSKRRRAWILDLGGTQPPVAVPGRLVELEWGAWSTDATWLAVQSLDRLGVLAARGASTRTTCTFFNVADGRMTQPRRDVDVAHGWRDPAMLASIEPGARGPCLHTAAGALVDLPREQASLRPPLIIGYGEGDEVWVGGFWSPQQPSVVTSIRGHHAPAVRYANGAWHDPDPALVRGPTPAAFRLEGTRDPGATIAVIRKGVRVELAGLPASAQPLAERGIIVAWEPGLGIIARDLESGVVHTLATPREDALPVAPYLSELPVDRLLVSAPGARAVFVDRQTLAVDPAVWPEALVGGMWEAALPSGHQVIVAKGLLALADPATGAWRRLAGGPLPPDR